MKKAIVTGGNGMIGQTLCQGLTKDGWNVASFDVHQGDQKDIQNIECDIADPVSVKDAFDNLGWKKIDLLINNAAYINDFSETLADIAPEVWDKVIRTNLTGCFLMSRAAAERMNKGCIINITSTRALMSEGGDFPYAASKGGILSLTQAMAISMGPDIRVNAIAPGWITDSTDLRKIDHEQHPAGRVGRSGDILQAVQYLATAEFVTGENLVVDGGMTKKMIYAD